MEKRPVEILDAGKLAQIRVESDFIAPQEGKPLDVRTTRVSETPQNLSVDNQSKVGAAFSGPVTGGYGGVFLQTWELTLPALWREFDRDAIYLTLDVGVAFTHDAWSPDHRQADAWVWEVDVADAIAGALPKFTHFRYVDTGLYRFIARVVGQLIGGTRKIRFGFRFTGQWVSGQPQEVDWCTSLNLTASIVSNSVYAKLAGDSVESGPLTSILDHGEVLDLALLFKDAEETVSPSPTEWAVL